MWLIVNRKELKVYLEGLSRLVRGVEVRNSGKEKCRPCAKEPEIRRVLLRLLDQTVEIGTEAGSVSGIVQEVGTDYVQLLEAGGTRVLIGFAHINFVQTV